MEQTGENSYGKGQEAGVKGTGGGRLRPPCPPHFKGFKITPLISLSLKLSSFFSSHTGQLSEVHVTKLNIFIVKTYILSTDF